MKLIEFSHSDMNNFLQKYSWNLFRNRPHKKNNDNIHAKFL